MTTYSKLDLTELTLANETLKSAAELIMEKFVIAGKFGQMHTIIPNIKFNKEVGLIGKLPIVGKARQGCEPTADIISDTASKKLWSQYNWEVILDFCAADLVATIARYDLKNGTQKGQLEGTVYFDALMELLMVAINDLLWRIWLADTEAANYDDSPAGVITDTISPTYFTFAEGYWKQIATIIADGNSDRLITIAANNEATYALQQSQLSSTLAFQTLENMIYGASPALRAQPKDNIMFWATRSLTDKASQYLQGLGIRETYVNLTDGVQALRVNGYDVIPIDIWDEQIRAYQDSGTKWNKPHRAILTTKDNILFGVPSANIIETVDANYLIKERIERIEASDDFSPLVLQDNLIQVAY